VMPQYGASLTVVKYAPRAINYAPRVVNYAPRVVNYAPIVVNDAPKEHFSTGITHDDCHMTIIICL
jgi:hypothetical protein